MSLGKVTVWYMTEEERLSYIAKHPIVPVDKPKEAKFSTDAINYHRVAEHRKGGIKGHRKIDQVDKQLVHKLFMSGTRLVDIAKSVNITMPILNRLIKVQRKIEPEKWPHRPKGGEK